MEERNKTRPAGGYATQRGINYQNRVAAFFAASSLSENAAFPGLPPSPIESIRCETGEPLADILLTFENGGIAFIEVKRTIQLTTTRMKPVLSQVIQQYIASDQGTHGGKFPWRRILDPTQDRILLVTSSESPEAVTKHLAACLSRIGPGAGPEVLATVAQNDLEDTAFRYFNALVAEAWKELMGVEPQSERVASLYSLFKIGTLDVNQDEADEQHAQNFLAKNVLSNPSEDRKAWSSLIQVMSEASESRQSLSPQQLRRTLVDSGFRLVSSPNYLSDIRSLREYTRLTLDSLDHLAILEVHGRRVQIHRQVTEHLRARAADHSLVVVGKPGAGKSGVLHELATVLQDELHDVVFLAADRIEESLKTELGLEHDLVDVLENWSGDRVGLLIIDALDAARGSNAFSLLRDLMRRVVRTEGSRWRVVASIRAFDLRYSQEMQAIFRKPAGEARGDSFQDNSFFDLRHVEISRFTPQELLDIRSLAPELNPIFESSKPALRELLEIPFNLRLVTEMVSSNLSDSELSAIETQVGLLNKYWLHRVVKSASEGTAREMVLVEVLRALVTERRLTVSKFRLREVAATKEFSSLCSDNVLVEEAANLLGRNIIGFSHHLLFDYAASRLLLAADFDRFLATLASERDLSLFLRPSIDLLFKEAWLKNRSEFWLILENFSAHDKIPAIAKIIGPAVIPELADDEQDLIPLIEPLSSTDQQKVDLAEQWIVHVVGAVLAGVTTSNHTLWSRFCLLLASSKSSLRVAVVCQSLVDHLAASRGLAETDSLEATLALSHAAVLLLDRFLGMETRDAWLVGRAITRVMELFWINRKESARVIRKLITADEIRTKGAEQGHWIARKISLLFDLDPDLVADIYTAFFGYEEESEERTSMGASRILVLTSNRRQDYHQTHWQLAEVFPRFLENNFDRCTGVVLAAVNSYIENKHKLSAAEQPISYRIGEQEHTVSVDYSAIWDSSGPRDDVLNIANAYFRKLEELSKVPETAGNADLTVTHLLRDAKYAYILRKLLNVAKTSNPTITRLLLPLLLSESALTSYDLSSAIGDVLSIGFETLDPAQRSQVESKIAHLADGSVDRLAEVKAHYRDILIGCIPEALLTNPDVIARRRELALAGGPPENRPPYLTHGIHAVPYSGLDRMRERGVPVDSAPNATLIEAADRLWAFASKFTNDNPQSKDVDDVKSQLTFVRDALSANNSETNQEVRNSAEAQLIAACKAIAKWKELDCSTAFGQTIKSILISGLSSPIPEHHPDDNAHFDRSPAWGAPLQRIEAASGIGALLACKKCFDKKVLESAQRVLKDPVPSVRFQVATRLLPLYETDLASLWAMLRDLAQSDGSTGVLGGALYAVLNPLSGRYKSEVVEVLKIILRREDLPNDGGEAFEWCYRIATGLYLWQGDASAYAVIEPTVLGPTFQPRRSAQCLTDIRSALTASSDISKKSDAEVRKRAFGLIETITKSASDRMKELFDSVDPEERSEQWQKDFEELARLVDYIGNQLYFSSGAYDGTDSNRTLSDNTRRIFWEESRAAITILSTVAMPSVAHHLIEILQSFIPFAPDEVFHAISSVVKSARSWGYQYESMAVDLLVAVTERYLAEQRSLLQRDLRCREELMDILETFVNAGWPSARRLSYHLEEIFR
jgi:hypothetical protein